MSEHLAISARGLSKRYSRSSWRGLRRQRSVITAVSNLDLDIPKGTIFGFLGPNGAGKTTTIRMLLGLVRPSAGSARVLGHDILRERSAIAPKVGAIVEVPSFYNHMSGAQNLLVLARSSNLNPDQKRIDQLLDRVGLLERGRDRVKTYSLGMKQRLGIAATLLSNPDVIFLDEPTNGLDPAGTVEVRNLIKRLGQEGHTIFLSSHLLGEVEHVCSDVAIIQHGVTKTQGRVQDLLSGAGGFAIEVGSQRKALDALRRIPELAAQPDGERWVTIAAQPDQIPELVRELVRADVDIYQVQARRNTLEKLFLELTGETSQLTAPEPAQEVAL